MPVNKTNARFLIDILLLLLLLMLLEQRSTGNFIHEWLGITLFISCVAHILLHQKWIRCVFRKFRTEGNGIKLIVNILLYGILVTILFSGLMISRELLPVISGGAGNHSFWRSVHDISAHLLIVLMGIHLALNWKKILNYFNKKVSAGKHARVQDQPVTLQAIHSSETASKLLGKDAKKNKLISASLKLAFLLLLFSAGISAGWYYISQDSQARPSSAEIGTGYKDSPPERFYGEYWRHGAGPINSHHEGHHDQFSLPGMLSGMARNITVLFLLVFIIVMAMEHFRSSKKINKEMTSF